MTRELEDITKKHEKAIIRLEEKVFGKLCTNCQFGGPDNFYQCGNPSTEIFGPLKTEKAEKENLNKNFDCQYYCRKS